MRATAGRVIGRQTTRTAARQDRFARPPWVNDDREQRAERSGRTKTDVVVEAAACLREHERSEDMECARERATLSAGIADTAPAAAPEVLDEWRANPVLVGSTGST